MSIYDNYGRLYVTQETIGGPYPESVINTARLEGPPLVLISFELADTFELKIGSEWFIDKYKLTLLREAPPPILRAYECKVENA